jgi:hypothetical protein
MNSRRLIASPKAEGQGIPEPYLACRNRPVESLVGVPGVGPALAFTLIALLPELGQMSRKQIAALVGLAPYDFDSGKLEGTSQHLWWPNAGP